MESPIQSKPSIHVRRAWPEDFAQIFQLMQSFAAFLSVPEKLANSVDQMLEDEPYFSAFVAEEDAVIVGFATWFVAYYSWTGKAIYVDDLFVQEGYRGKGIGQRLLNEVIATAHQQGCKKVRWQVSNWNKNAISFYKKMGAVVDTVEMNCELSL